MSECDGSVTLRDPDSVAKSGHFSLGGMCWIIQNNSGKCTPVSTILIVLDLQYDYLSWDIQHYEYIVLLKFY